MDIDTEWLFSNVGIIIQIGGYIGVFWIAIGKRYRELLLSKFTKKSQNLKLEDQELSVMERHQKYMDGRLLALISDNEKMLITISEQGEEIKHLQVKYRDSKEKINESAEEIKKAFRLVKYYKSLLDKNNIKYNETA